MSDLEAGLGFCSGIVSAVTTLTLSCASPRAEQEQDDGDNGHCLHQHLFDVPGVRTLAPLPVPCQ
jgi:hypothetical protein